jgi:hypothetical protein
MRVDKNKLTASGRTIAEMESINTGKKIPVSERALVARINRKLAQQGEKVCKSRTAWNYVSVGDYYVIDVNRNVTAGVAVDPESLAKELGVLKRYESLAED